MVVDFYATWCGPCRQLAPVVDKTAAQFAGKIKFVKVNVDESPKLAQQFQIQAIPALLFFKSNTVVDTSIGVISSNDLENKLLSLLQPVNAPGR